MRYEPKCCCGATALFETPNADMWTKQRVGDAYERWMKQHDGCPALYTAKPAPPSAPAYGQTYVYHEPMFGHGGIPITDTVHPKSAHQEKL